MSKFKVGQVVRFLGGPYFKIHAVGQSADGTDVYELETSLTEMPIMPMVLNGGLKALTAAEIEGSQEAGPTYPTRNVYEMGYVCTCPHRPVREDAV